MLRLHEVLLSVGKFHKPLLELGVLLLVCRKWRLLLEILLLWLVLLRDLAQIIHTLVQVKQCLVRVIKVFLGVLLLELQALLLVLPFNLLLLFDGRDVRFRILLHLYLIHSPQGLHRVENPVLPLALLEPLEEHINLATIGVQLLHC